MKKAVPEKLHPYKELTEKILNAASTVHERLGQTLRDKAYENALAEELQNLGVKVEQQKPMRVNDIGGPVRGVVVDLLVEGKIIVEVTAAHPLRRSFEEQLLDYLKSSGLELGLLINFGKKVQVRRRIFSRRRQSAKSHLGKEYISYCRRRLLKEYLPKIQGCFDELSEEDVWWRAHETDNSIGNLILHLCGNIRQWIISGIGGASDERNRALEFSERRHIAKNELMKRFEETLLEVDRVLEEFDADKLLEVRHFQKWDHTCLDAISHVVEHVGQHMGQIIYITKLRKGKDLKFWNL
jgi:GxxExxY protein